MVCLEAPTHRVILSGDRPRSA